MLVLQTSAPLFNRCMPSASSRGHRAVPFLLRAVCPPIEEVYGHIVHQLWIYHQSLPWIATRVVLTRLQCTKIVFGRGSSLDPAAGPYYPPPGPKSV